jgi:crotonobetainyl-CoA:carnitine CoA-transferase CaiB-like acyl-CoA transferase
MVLPPMGWHADRLKTVGFTGGADPVLPTPFCIGAAGAAALAATGLAASDLWELRTGRHQEIAVDVRQAIASLRAGRYMAIEDGRERDQQHPLMGVYPTKDGRWSYIHANFPNHRAAALTVLGCDATPEAVAAALSQWKALDFEDALIAAGGAGAMVRSRAEWAAHPQGRTIAALPLLEFIRIGESPPEPFQAGDRPLSGLRVVDLTRLLAGPVCGRSLAEHGAEVLKITAPHLPQMGYEDADTSHGKFAAHLDLRAPDDRETLRTLVQSADVFLQGYRPGALDARGFSPQALHELRPGLVYLSVCAFSHQGPWASPPRFRHRCASRQRHGVAPSRDGSGTGARPAILPGVRDRLLLRISVGGRRDGRAETARG